MRKKSHLKKLALLGITGGVMFSSHANAQAQNLISQNSIDPGIMIAAEGCAGGSDDDKGGPKSNFRTNFGGKGLIAEDKPEPSCSGRSGCPGMDNGKNGENGNGETSHADEMSETDLMSKLDYKGRQTYQSLGDEGKALARELAGMTCKGHNECKGLNSCRTDENECRGQGGCKGQSGCEFKDKNQAVEVAAKKMAEKRANLQNGN